MVETGKDRMEERASTQCLHFIHIQKGERERESKGESVTMGGRVRL